MNRKNLINIIIFIILSLLYCFLPLLISRCEAAEMMSEQQKYISVPMQQWNALKKNTQMLDANLILLEQNLTAQEQRSAELMNLLTEARNALSETQKALLNANASLASAEKSLQTATEYTVKLRRQIEAEREAAAEAKERAYWKGWLNGFCVGLVTTGIAVITK
jgi:septal ring factor EnvC (AmiA/AmiB activator)